MSENIPDWSLNFQIINHWTSSILAAFGSQFEVQGCFQRISPNPLSSANSSSRVFLELEEPCCGKNCKRSLGCWPFYCSPKTGGKKKNPFPLPTVSARVHADCGWKGNNYVLPGAYKKKCRRLCLNDSAGKIFINQYGAEVYRVHFNSPHINEGHHSAPFSKGAFTLRIMSSKQARNPGSHFHAIFISSAYLETYIVSSHSVFSSFEGLISIYIAT